MNVIVTFLAKKLLEHLEEEFIALEPGLQTILIAETLRVCQDINKWVGEKVKVLKDETVK
jgi:hypothetical protein